MNKILQTSCLSLFLLSFAIPSAFAQVYKWTDSDGRTHFSDRAPPEVSVKVVKSRTPKSTVQHKSKSYAEKNLEFAERQAQKAKDRQSAQEREDKKKQDEERQRLCNRAKGELKALESGRPLTRSGDNGQRILLDADARQKSTQERETFISDNCN